MIIVFSQVTDTSSSAYILSLTSLVFTTCLCNMDITITKKMLLQAISELQSKKKGQYLDNIRHFCEENYQWNNSKTDELLTSCVNRSILQKVVSNGKDSYRVVIYSIKNTQLNDIEVLSGDEHIIAANEGSSISPRSPIDLPYKEFTNSKTFVCQELNFIKQELSDVKQNTNKSDRRNFNVETWHRNTLDEKIVLLESNSSFLLLHNKQIIIEKFLDNIPSNSDKVKTAKHLSENQKQKVFKKNKFDWTPDDIKTEKIISGPTSAC